MAKQSSSKKAAEKRKGTTKRTAAKKTKARKKTAKRKSAKKTSTAKTKSAATKKPGKGTEKNKETVAGIPARVEYISIPPHAMFMRAKSAANRFRDELQSIGQVISVGVGRRFRGGICTEEWAIQVFVQTDEDKTSLVEDARSGKNPMTPYYMGIPVDVMVTGEIEPAIGGSFIQSFQDATQLGGGGTLGIDVHDFLGNRYWLTAAHVVQPTIGGAIGGQEIRFMNGNVVGNVSSSDDYARRDALADYALILADDQSSGLVGFPAFAMEPNPKGVRGIEDSDVATGTVWTIRGTRGFDHVAIGKIVGVDHPSVTMTTGETVDRPIVISGGSTIFAQQGDSGAAIISDVDQHVIAMVRGVSTSGLVIAGDIREVLNHVTIFR